MIDIICCFLKDFYSVSWRMVDYDSLDANGYVNCITWMLHRTVLHYWKCSWVIAIWVFFQTCILFRATEQFLTRFIVNVFLAHPQFAALHKMWCFPYWTEFITIFGVFYLDIASNRAKSCEWCSTILKQFERKIQLFCVDKKIMLFNNITIQLKFLSDIMQNCLFPSDISRFKCNRI